MSEDSNEPIFNEHGKASQLPQYDDITLRNMELITLNAAMRNSFVFGANNSSLFSILKQFHFHFGGLYDATFLETEKHLEDEEKVAIKLFLSNPIQKKLSHNLEDSINRKTLIDSVSNALDIFEKYQMAMRAGGFRKITYQSLSESHKSRRNF